MATKTLTPIDQTFPEGTSVSAYFADGHSPNGKPTGTPVETETVASNAVTFGNLAADRTYWAVGQVSGKYIYVGFYVPPGAPPVIIRADNAVANLMDLGAVPNDNSPAAKSANQEAWEEALSIVSSTLDGLGHGTNPSLGTMSGRVGTVLAPRGQFYMADTMTFDRIIHLVGEGGVGWWPATQFIFPDAVPGIHVTVNGGWSAINGVGLASLGRSSTSAHAINLEGRAHIKDFGIWNFGGDGLHIVAGVPDSNANLWSARQGSIYYCRNGMYVEGNDTNAGSAGDIDCSYNDLWGVYDNSFLGNAYFMMHTSNNNANPSGAVGTYLGGGAYSVGWTTANVDGNVNTCVLVGCYTEGGQNASRIGQNSQCVGCINMTTTAASSGVVLNAGSSGSVGVGLHVTPAIGATNTGSKQPYTASGTLGSNQVSRVGSQIDSEEYALYYNDYGTGMFAYTNNNAGAAIPLQFTTAHSAYPAGYSVMPNGLILPQRSASGVPNNTLFADAADDKLKYKDASGVTHALF